MTGNGKQEQDAELARQAEALREQGMPIFRAVQQYIADAAEAGARSAARQLSEALDLSVDDVIAAVRNLKTDATFAAAGAAVAAGAALNAEGRVVAFADVGTGTDSLSVVKLEDIGELATRAARDGIVGLSIMQVLALVLVWLLVYISISVVQQLPGEVQAKLTNDIGILTVGLMMTLAIVQKRKR